MRLILKHQREQSPETLTLGLCIIVTLSLAASACAGGLTDRASLGNDNAVTLSVGESIEITIPTHCGYEWLEVEINGGTWRTDGLPLTDTGVPREPTWPNGEASVEFVIMLIRDDALDVRAIGSIVTHRYVLDKNPPGCA